MRHALKSLTTSALQVAALHIFERYFLPAIAVGLVALAHELHADGAEREGKRRMGR